jgi:hypothetical protein
VPPIMPPQDGFFFLDHAKFAESFAADVKPALAAFMGDSQVPWGLDALNGAVTNASWKSKPSWYLVATDDKMIPPDAQRAMAIRAGAKVAEAKAATRSMCRSRRSWRTLSHRPWQVNGKPAFHRPQDDPLKLGGPTEVVWLRELAK